MTEYQAKHHYSGATAEAYDAQRLLTRAQRRKWLRELELVERFLGRFPADRLVVDVPSGTGRALPVIARSGHRPVAVDISLDMLLQARLHSGSAVVADAEGLPLADQSVDIVVCLRLFQHLPEIAARAVLSEFGRVARFGLIVEAPLRQPVTPLVNLLRSVAGKRSSGSGLDRAFPMHPRDFRGLLSESGGFTWREQGHVTWWGGQTKVVWCSRKSADAP